MKTIHAPMGRLNDYTNKLTPEVAARTGTRAGSSLFDDYQIMIFPSRGALLTAVRMAENGYRPIRPLIK